MINNGNNNCARSEDLSKEIKMDTASQRGTSNTSNHRDYCHCRHNVCDRLVMTEHMVSYRRYYRQKKIRMCGSGCKIERDLCIIGRNQRTGCSPQPKIFFRYEFLKTKNDLAQFLKNLFILSQQHQSRTRSFLYHLKLREIRSTCQGMQNSLEVIVNFIVLVLRIIRTLKYHSRYLIGYSRKNHCCH